MADRASSQAGLVNLAIINTPLTAFRTQNTHVDVRKQFSGCICTMEASLLLLLLFFVCVKSDTVILGEKVCRFESKTAARINESNNCNMAARCYDLGVYSKCKKRANAVTKH